MYPEKKDRGTKSSTHIAFPIRRVVREKKFHWVSEKKKKRKRLKMDKRRLVRPNI